MLVTACDANKEDMMALRLASCLAYRFPASPAVGDVIDGFQSSSSAQWVLTWQGSPRERANSSLDILVRLYQHIFHLIYLFILFYYCCLSDEFNGPTLNASNWTPANNFTLNSLELEMYQV